MICQDIGRIRRPPGGIDAIKYIGRGYLGDPEELLNRLHNLIRIKEKKIINIKIDKEGIAFGKYCWISHTKILGINEERAPIGKPLEGKTIVEKQYLKFIQDYLIQQER